VVLRLRRRQAEARSPDHHEVGRQGRTGTMNPGPNAVPIKSAYMDITLGKPAPEGRDSTGASPRSSRSASKPTAWSSKARSRIRSLATARSPGPGPAARARDLPNPPPVVAVRGTETGGRVAVKTSRRDDATPAAPVR
jgi:hypothetical protein